MPIPSLAATGFTAREDSRYFTEKLVDPTIRKEFEGGFAQTRRRFTRQLREITTGFTDLSDADKAKFMAFLASVGVGAGSFAYTHPVSQELLTVRFKEAPQASYSGTGGLYRWDIKDIKLETV